MLLARVLRYRTMKFRPKLVSSFRPHGKWGDLIICIVPIFWCFNILVNSNFLLKLLEWQAESSLFTIRIRGKQWYWVYKLDFKNFTDIISTPKNIGNNKWMFSFFGELKTSDNYLHIIQSRSQNKWIKNYWSQNFNKFSDEKKTKFNLINEYTNFDNNFDNIYINNNVEIQNNFNKNEFIDNNNLIYLNNNNTGYSNINDFNSIISNFNLSELNYENLEIYCEKMEKILNNIEYINYLNKNEHNKLYDNSCFENCDFSWINMLLDNKNENKELNIDIVSSDTKIDKKKKDKSKKFDKNDLYCAKFDYIRNDLNKFKESQCNNDEDLNKFNKCLEWFNNYFRNKNNNFFNSYSDDFINSHKSESILKENIIFSNIEDNSRLSKNFFGKQKLIFLIKKDIKKINFLEKNFFFKFRFNSFNSNFKNKYSSNSSYFTFKQKRYKRRTIVPKFLKNYKNIENKDLIFSGFLNLNSNYSMEDNINNPTKYYRMLRKNRSRSENMPVSISKRLLRVKRTLVIPTNINITAITNSYDVVHSWFIPGLGLKMDCVPGRSTHHTFYVDNAGFYYGQCAEICGRYHHHMPIRVCALPFEHFLIWWNTFGLPKIIFNKKGFKSIKSHSLKKFVW